MATTLEQSSQHVPGYADNTQEQPPSGFTAVNGRSPTGPRQRSQDRGVHDDADSSAAAPTNGFHDHSRSNGNSHNTPPPIHVRADSGASLGKRKRSVSAHRSPESSVSPSQKRYQHEEAADADGMNGSAYDSSESNGSADPDRHVRYGDAADHAWSSQRESELHSDAQLAEALQRGTQQLSDSNGDVDASPGSKYPSMSNPHGGPGVPPSMSGQPHPMTPAMTAASYQKQRKRNFSNRTKTGCMTCRRRKKKCGEEKPFCRNCERGGFTCEGYQQQASMYNRATPMIPPAPLQAKHGYYDPAYAYPPPPGRPPVGLPSAPPGAFFPSQPEHAAGGRPANVELVERERPAPHPQEAHVSSYAPPGPWSEAPPSRYPVEPYRSAPTHAPDARDHKKLPGLPTGPPHPSGPPSTMHPNPRTDSNSSYSDLAARALQQQREQRAVYHSEKDKMRNRQPFSHRDPQLRDERKQCAIAVHKFNELAKDPQNLSEEERMQRFRQIIEPKADVSTHSPPPSRDRATGKVGKRVLVDAPFYCDYGYNISIGDDTEIGANCRIMDSARVNIGHRVYIGPNVSIYTQQGFHGPVDSQPLGTAKRLFVAQEVTIEDDVHITGDCCILPGVKVGWCSTVGAGVTINSEVKSHYQYESKDNLQTLRGPWEHEKPSYLGKGR